MPAEDYEQGVSGAGDAWEQGVQDDQAQQNYQSGATEDAASDYENEASQSGDEYAEGVANYLGINENDVTVDNEYESGVSSAGNSWQQGVQRSGEKWAAGVQGKGDEYERNAAEAADEWMAGYREGVTQD